jgi:hypothetical protein
MTALWLMLWKHTVGGLFASQRAPASPTGAIALVPCAWSQSAQKEESHWALSAFACPVTRFPFGCANGTAIISYFVAGFSDAVAGAAPGAAHARYRLPIYRVHSTR